MSQGTPLQEWLPRVGEHSLYMARRHVAAETSTDTDYICSTISRDVFFAVPVRKREGNALPPESVLTSYDAVHDYYAGRADAYVVLDSKQLKSVAGDWYVFNESAATLRGTGSIGASDAAGAEFVVNSAILFPTADDGIRGEICVTRHPFDDVVSGQAPSLPSIDASFPRHEMDHTTLLDEFVEALRGGDSDEVGHLLAQPHSLAMRLDTIGGTPRIETTTSRADAEKILAAAFEGAADTAIVSRIATDWYVFAEYVAEIGEKIIRRFAAIHPIEDGKLTGTFGYGRDEIRGEAD
ncbi:MAG: hypothetical protein JRG86_04405 [Deltaproteobacteria bacterium]|jgi:hypothetical protein|nr:hypothetical protein [Deltaproteobacteria bacterium]